VVLDSGGAGGVGCNGLLIPMQNHCPPHNNCTAPILSKITPEIEEEVVTQEESSQFADASSDLS